MIEIRNYIDWQKLAKDLETEFKSDYENVDIGDSDVYAVGINNFFNNRGELELLPSDCDFDGKSIHLEWGIDHINANESDNQGSFVCVYMIYDIIIETFVYFNVEQG